MVFMMSVWESMEMLMFGNIKLAVVNPAKVSFSKVKSRNIVRNIVSLRPEEIYK